MARVSVKTQERKWPHGKEWHCELKVTPVVISIIGCADHYRISWRVCQNSHGEK